MYAYRKREILNEKELGKSLVIDYRLNSKGYITLEYYYIVKNDTITSSEHYQFSSYAGKNLVNKYFPVIYSKKDITKHKILIEEKDFNDFKVPYPDSLRWVKKFRW